MLTQQSLTLSSKHAHFNMLKKKRKKSLRKTLWKKVKLLKMSNFTVFHNVFYANCILKSFNSHTSIVVCSFLEFGTVSKLCNREWVYILKSSAYSFSSILDTILYSKTNHEAFYKVMTISGLIILRAEPT